MIINDEGDDAYFLYMILNGKFDVQSLNFVTKNVKKGDEKYAANLVRKKQEKMERGNTIKLMYDSDEEDNDVENDKNHKTLSCGDFFGEVSIIYNCKRTSSIYGNTYGTYGKLNEETVKDLFIQHPGFETYLKDRIIHSYDDDLKVFLMHAFKGIDYLQNMPKEVLIQLAYCMEVNKMEADSYIFRAEENYMNFVIIFDGLVEIYTEMDNGTEFPIEHLRSGSVINAHQFLIDRPSAVSVRCIKASTFYTMNAWKLIQKEPNMTDSFQIESNLALYFRPTGSARSFR